MNTEYNNCTAKTEIENIEKRLDKTDRYLENNFKSLYEETKSNRGSVMEAKNEFTNNINKAVNEIKSMIIKFFFGILGTIALGAITAIITTYGK